ncbi:hypothetical protein BGZ63DRAFT_355906 [Mariannaea sp. PMI_226]|nr:hypothetical protein BGZ63DRAFT_355906 [Mariannaea sp. PMI_226]
MPHMREVKTCDRCRHFKRRCDLIKPSCSRCLLADDSRNSLDPSNGGLISPTTSIESPEPLNPPSGPGETGGIFDSPPEPVAPPSGPRVIRKRKRNCLSCLRCHRLKVKCDKELPCGRCKSSGNGRECYYTYNKGPNGGKFPCPTAPISSTGDDSKSAIATWQVSHKVRGSSHWRDLMAKIGAHISLESSPLASALEDVATNACLANFTLPGNFPFGTPGATKYFAKDAVTRLIESERANCSAYITRYVYLLDSVSPVLDLENFHKEVEQYWNDPNGVSLCWLSQFLMVLGLGCFASVEEPHQATELMMAAEACLMQTPFMFRPTLLSLKTLTIMVVAKQVCNATCWSVDSCWSLLGLLVRTAFIYGLPQEQPLPGSGETIDAKERCARRKLWLTILYLDIKVSMSTGMPPLTRPDELGSLRAMGEWGEPDSFQMVLYRSLPTVLTILGQLNSKQDPISYPDVLRYNTQIRELMAHANSVCNDQLQRITVDVFLRRSLMVLYRPFALHADGPTLFPEAYWGSLECSLALLVHYRELWGCDPTQRLDLVGRAFVLDFFSAALTACLHVLSKEAPLAGGAAGLSCEVPPRKIILETLRSCIDIWGGERDKSVCWRTGYNLLLVILDLLPETSVVE